MKKLALCLIFLTTLTYTAACKKADPPPTDPAPPQIGSISDLPNGFNSLEWGTTLEQASKQGYTFTHYDPKNKKDRDYALVTSDKQLLGVSVEKDVIYSFWGGRFSCVNSYISDLGGQKFRKAYTTAIMLYGPPTGCEMSLNKNQICYYWQNDATRMDIINDNFGGLQITFGSVAIGQEVARRRQTTEAIASAFLGQTYQQLQERGLKFKYDKASGPDNVYYFATNKGWLPFDRDFDYSSYRFSYNKLTDIYLKDRECKPFEETLAKLEKTLGPPTGSSRGGGAIHWYGLNSVISFTIYARTYHPLSIVCPYVHIQPIDLPDDRREFWLYY